MTYRNVDRIFRATISSQGVHHEDYISSGNSPRVNGRLNFRQNELSQRKSQGKSSAILLYRTTPNGSNNQHSIGLTPGAFFNACIENKGPQYGGYAAFPTKYREDIEARLRSKVSAEVVNLADMWRTRKETVNMITSTVLRLGNSYSSLRKGDVPKALGHLGITYRRKHHKKLRNISAPDAWLELQYGWKPLLGDIYDIAEKPWNVVQGVVKVRRSYSEVNRFTAPDSQIDKSGVVTVDYVGTARTNVIFDGSALVPASRLGLLNPATLAWEALPFSFIVDWFLPIGDWLESFTSFTGVRMTDYSFSWKNTMKYDVYADYTKFYTISGRKWFPVANALQKASGYQVFKGRVRTGLPTRTFPKFKNPLSLGHFANATSLLASAFDRKR